MNSHDDVMATMGQIAIYVRFLVGGKDINGFRDLPPANIEEAARIMVKMRGLIDKYDAEILSMMRKDQKEATK
jgi:hypothetical protein